MTVGQVQEKQKTERPLEGRVALVTGGSRGIGAAVARRLAEAGASVVVTYVNSAEAAERVAGEVRKGGARAEAIRADAADSGEMASLVGKVVERFGRLDVLVNSAGITPMGALEETTEEDFDQTVDINVRAVFLASREAAKVMEPGGRIVNVGSVWGELVPTAGIGLYAMSKFAVAGMTRAWARDLGPKGITVNCVQPGPIDTDMNPADGPMSGMLTPLTALGRYGRPQELAELVAFLAGPESSYLTGATINADGGLNA
jgi:3-oxoacyl-[acyl-carrier protein] reductase